MSNCDPWDSVAGVVPVPRLSSLCLPPLATGGKDPAHLSTPGMGLAGLARPLLGTLWGGHRLQV